MWNTAIIKFAHGPELFFNDDSILLREKLFISPTEPGAFLVAQTVANLPAMRETQVGFLDPEDPLEKDVATHSSILPRESHGQRSLAGYSPWGHKRVRYD